MNPKLFSIVFFLAVAVLGRVVAGAGPLPAPWKHQDIGAVSVAGSASKKGDAITLQGTLDIWGVKDGCHFAWQPLKGDGVIVARVLSVEETQHHAKGGLAIRESLAAGSRHATMVATPADGTQFLSRVQANGPSTSQKTGLNKGTMPYWLKLERKGNRFTGYESTDGKEWIQTGTIELNLPANTFVGLVASSHQQDTLCAVKFDKVRLRKRSK